MVRLPDEFSKRMREYLGDEYDSFLASYDEVEVKGLRFSAVGDGMSPAAYFGEVCNFEQIPWESCGYAYKLKNDLTNYLCDEDCKDDCLKNICDNDLEFDGGVSFGKHPYHEAGAYYIQEPSAMAPAFYLDVKPGERVLDLCASPGGKSTQIGTKMQGDGILVSNEINASRAKVLSENIERMGIKNALVINEDPRDISDRFSGFFDKILVDAPCSGEGMFRRSETAINEWSLDNVIMCANRQSWILDEAAKMLKEGGTLVYSTCTFSKEENEYNIASFLERHNDFALAEVQLFDGMVKGFDNIGIRLYPHKLHGEGHFVCKLVKSSETISYNHNFNNSKSGIVNKKNISKIKSKDAYLNSCRTGDSGCSVKFEPGLSEKQKAGLTDMYSFVNDNLSGQIKKEIVSKNLIMFGDNIYMLPEGCPVLKGLKVLRPGLHLGTMKKNRFEPAHALAKALSPSEIRQSINVILNPKVNASNNNAPIKSNVSSVNIAPDLNNVFCLNIELDNNRQNNVAHNNKQNNNKQDNYYLADNDNVDNLLVMCETKDNNVIYKYLAGEIFNIDACLSGWSLVCVDGFPAGFGKVTNGTVKNHYPKGLRKHLVQ